ncbi:MAG: glycoside hydrolase family 29, partial [Bacteroidales bacterium]
LRGYNGHDWFWEPGHEHTIYPLDKLVDMYYNSVGHNTSLILGLTPGPDGLMPEPDVKRLKEFGEEIERRFSDPIASVSGTGKEIKLRLPNRQWTNQVVIQENIAEGERVREFLIEGKTKDGWKLIFEGSCIGHKFIHRFDKMQVDEIRLRIPESRGEPQIKTFEVYNVD